MKKILSRDARFLTVRLLLAILALGAFFGVYDNRDFLTKFPFFVLALFDISFGIVFLYAFVQLRTLPAKLNKLLALTVLVYGVYSVLVALTSFWYYAANLGLSNIASAENISVSLYVTQQIAYLGVAPAIAFFALWWLVRTCAN